MTEEQKQFLFELVDEQNYLGAAQYLRETETDKSMRSARMGTVVEAVIRDLDKARSRSDRERVVYLRSVLAWLLKEFPGLASIYREQLRVASGGNDVLPDLARGFRNVNDVLSGKKTVQEGVEDASEPLEGLADQAGKLFTDGLNQLGDFFSKMNGGSPADESKKEKPGQSASKTKEAEGSAQDPSTPVDIVIEDADDPLPHDIHDAEDK